MKQFNCNIFPISHEGKRALEIYETDSYYSHETLLQNVSMINFLVGENNVGKSRFLRLLMSELHKQVKSKDFDSWKPGDSLRRQNVNSVRKVLIDGHELAQPLEVIKEHLLRLDRTSNPVPEELLFDLITFINGVIRDKAQFFDYNDRPCRTGYLEPVKEYINDNIHLLQASITKRASRGMKFYYIPTFRTSLHLVDRENDPKNEMDRSNIPRDTIIQNYFTSTSNISIKNRAEQQNDTEYADVFTGADLYESIKRDLLGLQNRRDLVRDFQLFLSEYVYENKSVVLIPKHTGNPNNDHTLYVKIGDDADRAIYDVGDGIQSLIIMSYPMFVNEKAYFFIEEPELHMHPGMQRKF